MVKAIREKKIIIGVLTVFILLSLTIYLRFSYAQTIDNDSRVAENSELTYYIDVIYDGKDKDAQLSSDTAIAQVHSGFIDVQDKIPEGLEFERFISSEDGTIGAVKRSNEKETCPGLVVGGLDGLHYDETTRTISFRVQNLQAGCKLTVGFVTRTPRLKEKKRLDFYNTAFGREQEDNATSNTVHVFMGQEEEQLYNVKYQYEGENLPDNLPPLPPTLNYAAGVEVGVSGEIVIDGYIFEGWTSEDVQIEKGTFTMPSSNVVIKGRFSKKKTYDVEYTIEGNAPKGYTLPDTSAYGEGDQVVVDDLKEGDIIDGYIFKGWQVEEGEVELEKGKDNTFFTMPKKKVILKGTFEQIKYTVTYQYQGTVPEGADALLPPAEKYVPGAEVEVKKDPVLAGYTFSGWYQTSPFEMPNNDVVIYGEWSKQLGKFQPSITKQIDNEKSSYQQGEKVNFTITVTNTAEYAITDVLLEETLEGSKFVNGDNYEVLNDQYVRIARIEASGSVQVKEEYTAGSETAKKYENVVVLASATGENGDLLDDSKEYKAIGEFVVANIALEIHKTDEKKEPLEGSEFTLYKDEGLKESMGTGLSFRNLEPDKTYYLKETKVPTGYVILSKPLTVKIAEDGTIAIDGYEVKNDSGKAEVDIINEKISLLPNTGGRGVVSYVILGTILTFVAVVGMMALAILYRKQKRNRNKE